MVGHGRFTVLTGIGGEAWVAAAQAVAERFSIPVDSHLIGPGRELTDLFGDWADAREIDEAGCALVRPDAHVAWRAHHAANNAGDAARRLSDALGRILGVRHHENARAAE